MQFNSSLIYHCPVCRSGRLNPMSLMDTVACAQCNQIFTPENSKQQIKLISSRSALVWQWNGKNWVGAHTKGIKFDWSYKLIATAFVVLPPSLIGLTLYFFVSTAGTTQPWFPYFWTGFAFLSHLGIIGLVLIEFYQIPVGIYLRVMQQRLRNQLLAFTKA